MINKRILDVQAQCSEFLGFDHLNVEQTSHEWFLSKMGVVSASKAYILLMDDAAAPFPQGLEIVAVKRGVNKVEFNGETFTGTKEACKTWVRSQLPPIPSDTRITYMNELIAQIATGSPSEEVSAKPLQWGRDHESDACDAYSAATFESIDHCSFLYNDISMRAGISPDGLVNGEDKGLELKCPWSSSVWIAFAGQGIIKPQEIAQVQFSMMITGFKSWGFAKYDPRNVNCKKLHHVEIFRDEAMIARLQKGLDKFIADMDKALEVLGLSFGDQWK